MARDSIQHLHLCPHSIPGPLPLLLFLPSEHHPGLILMQLPQGLHALGHEQVAVPPHQIRDILGG